MRFLNRLTKRAILSPRETFILFTGAALTFIITTYSHLFPLYSGDLLSSWTVQTLEVPLDQLSRHEHTPVQASHQMPVDRPKHHVPSQFAQRTIHPTKLLHNAPGWTLFTNFYMSNGTFFIVADEPKSSFPETRYIVSNPEYATADLENAVLREPKEHTLQFITVEEAKHLWPDEASILHVSGNSVIVNEPAQFISHYYHAIAELWFGVWAFWSGAHTSSSSTGSSKPTIGQVHFAHAPPLTTPQEHGEGWRDPAQFNGYLLRGLFPTLSLEDKHHWKDRVVISKDLKRVWKFDKVLLTDRSASFRGVECGSKTQRIAAEAFEYMKNLQTLEGVDVGGWWDPMRRAVWEYTGSVPAKGDTEKVVITYISRQSAKHRKLVKEDHEALVKSLKALCERRKGWEVNVVEAEKVGKDEQIRIAAKTDILLGVHGNGLTHLLWMPTTKISTVIEIFYPGGFAHDYYWTSTALGMEHFSIWKDTHHTRFDKPNVDYPEGFQENHIPVNGDYVASIIERRVDGKIPQLKE